MLEGKCENWSFQKVLSFTPLENRNEQEQNKNVEKKELKEMENQKSKLKRMRDG